MDETDDAAHLQSMLEDFSDGELVDDLLPVPSSSSKVEVRNASTVNDRTKNEVAIFVSNLAAEINEKLLETLFSEFGPIRTLEIIQSSATHRFAFITYYDHADANAARFTMDGKNYLGSKLIVHWRRRKTKQQLQEEQTSVIWVGDLDKEISSEDLQEAFAPFGEVVACKVIRDPETFESKGYGFVSYRNNEDAEMAIETMQGQWIKSKLVRTSWARQNNQRVREFERKNILFLKGAPRYETYVQCQQTFDTISNQTGMSNRTIFIGGISHAMLNRDMMNLAFGPFGFIEDIKLCNGKSSEKPGYAFILYATKESACNAIMCMHNKVLDENSKPLRVHWGKEKYNENYEENYCEPAPPPYEFGRPFEDFQRTIQGYGCPPGPPGPPIPGPLQFSQQQPVEPCITNMPPDSAVVVTETAPCPPPEDESGYHAFSYYGTYVYQENVDTEDEDALSSGSSSSSASDPPPAVSQQPAHPPPNPPQPKQRLKSVAKIRTKEPSPVVITKKKQDSCSQRDKSRSRSVRSRSSKVPSHTKRKRDSSSSTSSSSSSTRSLSRRSSRSRYRSRSHERSRSLSRNFSDRDRRSRSRSRSFDSGDRHRPVKSRIVRKKQKLPFMLPNHHPPTVPTFNHNIHAINQSTILSFPAPGSSNYQQQHYQHHPIPPGGPQLHFPNIRSSLPPPPHISYGPPPQQQQHPTFLNPPTIGVQGPPPHGPPRHQCYVNPNFVNHNQIPFINHPHQEYNQNYAIPNYQHQNPIPNNIPHNFLYQNQFQINESNASYDQRYAEEYQQPVYDNNYYQLQQSGPRINNNITYYPPK